MRKWLLAGAAVLALTSVSAAGGYWWIKGRFIESTDDAYLQSDISIIAPKVAGYVKRIPVVENQHVAIGDVLAIIDDQDFAAAVDQAKAQVASARAAIGNIDSQRTLQESRIAQARADIAAADADLAFARSDLGRYGELMRTGAASRQHFESAQQAERKAIASLDKAKAALESEQRQLGVLDAQRNEAEANLKQAEAALALRQNDLDNTVIRAPVDGIVGNKGVDVGQYVKAGTQLFALVPDSDVYVVANYKETQIGHVQPGQPVEVTVDAFSGETVKGRVESFAPASGAQFSLLPPENATGNFTKVVQRIPIRIALPQNDPLTRKLRPGLSVEAKIDTRGSKGAADFADTAAKPAMLDARR